MKKSLLIAVILMFVSCKSLIRSAYGITEPKSENKESLTSYLNSKKISTDNILLANSETNYVEYLKDFGSIPEALLFDSNGDPLSYKNESQDCNAGLFSTIPELNSNTKLKQIEGKKLSEFVENLIDFNGNKITNLPEADFYMFISWAKFTGKLNKDHVKVWEELAEQNKSVKIKVFKVNMDFKDGWEIEFK